VFRFRVLTAAFCLLLSSSAFALDFHYCDLRTGRCEDHYVAHAFIPFEDLTPAQKMLLLESGVNYESWISREDSHAATFLAITHVLDQMELDLGDGDHVFAIQMLKRVSRFEGDRIRVILDREIFDRWRSAGSKFTFVSSFGKRDDGRIKFRDHTILGGSLHEGYDIQGFTGVVRTPRLQINYRFRDSEADIDLDGYAPLILGFIPNLKHLTYENSDPRQWFEKLIKRFGDPGFRVKPY
jgi:hypothetical protein